ncbi:hypothetical protein CNQ87_15415 [Lysinibacillus fusiformis]|uniref:hypothetical protein n=1 Tax=Lysinibacillus fusiformis TaxID=28031 RepID=UPI000BBA8B68|nr:hypothetical protein [Lysinibacillus fusiformis]PCD81994.1 hypothetical protein CNQ87_15415 [Lysinibacillus fusiformis]
MPYNVTLSRNAKVHGVHRKAGQVVENVSDKLYEELQERDLVENAEEAKAKRSTKQTGTVEEKAGE